MARIPVAVLGGTGYVAAEAIRLLLTHPGFELKWIVSQSSPGEKLTAIFPHLAGLGDGFRFVTEADFLAQAQGQEVAVVSALPHGASTSLLSRIDQQFGDSCRIVDLSADFRLRDKALHASIYGPSEVTDELWDRFTFGLPELQPGLPARHVSHPGCFATCMTLAAAPLAKAGVPGPFVITGITGSTGSGASPKPGTHHPSRTGAVWAYEPGRHRHVPEVEVMLADLGKAPKIWFVPHSGPFARGMHVTLQAESNLTGSQAETLFNEFYEGKSFITVSQRMPSVREVASTNRCHIGVTAAQGRVVVTAVIDNLVKGAAGGGIQWLNRACGLDETSGLMAAGDMWA